MSLERCWCKVCRGDGAFVTKYILRKHRRLYGKYAKAIHDSDDSTDTTDSSDIEVDNNENHKIKDPVHQDESTGSNIYDEEIFTQSSG